MNLCRKIHPVRRDLVAKDLERVRQRILAQIPRLHAHLRRAERALLQEGTVQARDALRAAKYELRHAQVALQELPALIDPEQGQP